MSPASSDDSGRLVVVSNRLPVLVREGESGPELAPGSGGLVTALAPILGRRSGLWVGWPGAIVVNPHDLEQTAEALYRAVTMPVEERKQRMRKLRAEVRRNDVHRWVGWFTESFAEPTAHDAAETERARAGARARGSHESDDQNSSRKPSS